MPQKLKKRKFKHAVLLGMGGSSLCPEVMRMTFGKIKGFPEMHVLDSTDPVQIKALEKKLDLKKTLCIVSSKSGSTLEPNIFKQYFFERVKAKVGAEKAGSHFIAVTDPGSKMQQVAEGDKFWKIYSGVPSIGGRYSALSNFGMVPAAAMGLDVPRFLKTTHEMVTACGATSVADSESRRHSWRHHGRQRPIKAATSSPSSLRPEFTISAPGLNSLSPNPPGKSARASFPWTAKNSPSPQATAMIASSPICVSHPNPTRRRTPQSLRSKRRAIRSIRITLPNIYAIGQEFFRWEIATAVAGSIIGINAFNQPDVEASKIETRKLTSRI